MSEERNTPRAAKRASFLMAAVAACLLGLGLGLILHDHGWTVGGLAVAMLVPGWAALAIAASTRWRRDGATGRSDLMRVLVRSSGAIAAVAVVGIVGRALVPVGPGMALWDGGYYLAAGNGIHCLVRLLLRGDRLVSAIALVICVLAAGAVVFMAPLIGH